MEKICFIINPKAGYQKYNHVIEIIKKKLDVSKFQYKIELSKNKYDIKKITKREIKNNTNFFVAVGGDGTVNEICSEIVNTNIKIGVIPIGSGNGLAYEMGLTKNIEDCITTINNNCYKEIDSISINNLFSFNVAGIGYDAFVAKYFSQEKKRGMFKYMYLSFYLLNKYRSKKYTISFNEKKININPFTIAICNSRQYGNNFYICPEAKIDDGKINLCLIEDCSFINLISLTWKFYFGKINKSKLYKTYKSNNITIDSSDNILMHVDGESVNLDKKVEISINEKSIKFVC